MYKSLKIISFFTLLTAILQPNINLIAQEVEGEDWDMIEEAQLNTNGVKSGEIINCSDLYNPSNIAVSFGVNKSVYKPSDVVEIGASITNNNPYPIIDATIRARILSPHPNPIDRRAKYITVDDILIKENVILKANETNSFEATYFIPVNAPSGEYAIQYYVYNQDRFNIVELPFREDVLTNSTIFNVEGESQNIYLDKTNITIDGKEYDGRDFMLQVVGNKNTSIKIPLVNPENTAQEMVVNYKLYKRDDLLQSNLIKETTEQVIVPANSRIDLEYSLDTIIDPVYYLVITSNVVGERETDAFRTKTMAHIRLSVESNNIPRINWVGLDKYPFQPGEEVGLITCLSNSLYKIDKNEYKLKSIVKDSKDKDLTKIEYEGEVVPSIRGLINKFNSKNNINQITIETSLYNANNELVDNITTTYDCNELSPESCIKEESEIGNIFGNNKYILYIIATILGVILLSVSSLIVRRYNNIKQ